MRCRLEETVQERTTELQKTVEQLQQELTQRTLAEKRFEDLIQFAPDAVLMIHPDGTILLANAQMERLFGYTRAELLGKNYQCLVISGQRKQLAEYMDTFIAHPSTRQSLFGLTFSAQRQDGSQFPIELSLSHVETWDGFWIACIARDITERVQAEEERTRFIEEIQRSGEQLRALTIRLSEAQESQQRKMSRELHDQVGQNLTGLNLNLQVIQNLIKKEDFASVRKRLDDSILLVEEITKQVRNVMANLTPPLLEEFGLRAALLFSCERFMDRTGILTTLSGEDFQPRLSQREEMAFFRIVQEGLNNIAKHANATRVFIQMETTKRYHTLILTDDGQGFDLQKYRENSSLPHWGLMSMEERAASIGGELTLQSSPGHGTCLKIRLQRREKG